MRRSGRSKSRGRGHTSGELPVGMAAAQPAGEDFLVGLDRHRADTAGQVLAPVAGLSSTTAAGLARRFIGGAWHGVETGIGDIHTAMLAALPAARAAALCDAVTIDLDTTDVEVYGSQKRGGPTTTRGKCDTRSHVMSGDADWRPTDDVGGVVPGECSAPVPALTCVAGDGGVRSSGKKPEGLCSIRGLQARGRPAAVNTSESLYAPLCRIPGRWRWDRGIGLAVEKRQAAADDWPSVVRASPSRGSGGTRPGRISCVRNVETPLRSDSPDEVDW
ncbi:MAG: hypothetical protein LC700_00375 [Actinobacteria bacterium]|nr:hypothetical protein [Actinomycetota bacterium]